MSTHNTLHAKVNIESLLSKFAITAHRLDIRHTTFGSTNSLKYKGLGDWIKTAVSYEEKAEEKMLRNDHAITAKDNQNQLGNVVSQTTYMFFSEFLKGFRITECVGLGGTLKTI